MTRGFLRLGDQMKSGDQMKKNKHFTEYLDLGSTIFFASKQKVLGVHR